MRAGLERPLRALANATVRPIPLIGRVYGLADRFVGLLEQKEEADIRAMSPVWCFFGGGGAAVLALAPSAEPIEIDGTSYLGALRRFLSRRGEDVGQLDFRAMVPVNVRRKEDAGSFGNRVSMLAAPLPLDEPDPRRRLARIVETTSGLKASKLSEGIETIEEISEWGLTRLFTQLSRLTALSRPFNVVVTNVPGPQIQAYLLGCPLRAAYPLVPLYKNQAVGIALFSYQGGLFWGLNADWDAVPDLHELVDALREDFEALRKAAAEAGATTEDAGRARPPSGGRRTKRGS